MKQRPPFLREHDRNLFHHLKELRHGSDDARRLQYDLAALDRIKKGPPRPLGCPRCGNEGKNPLLELRYRGTTTWRQKGVEGKVVAVSMNAWLCDKCNRFFLMQDG